LPAEIPSALQPPQGGVEFRQFALGKPAGLRVLPAAMHFLFVPPKGGYTQRMVAGSFQIQVDLFSALGWVEQNFHLMVGIKSLQSSAVIGSTTEAKSDRLTGHL